MSKQAENFDLIAFATVARAFCEWAETGDPTTELAEQHLADLHAAILRVHLAVPVGDAEIKDAFGPEQWKIILARLGATEPRTYRSVYDPLEENPQVDIVPLADDLADIYRDVKEGLNLFDKGQLDDARWEWRYHFQIHWGRHLTSAASALYAYNAGATRI